MKLSLFTILFVSLSSIAQLPDTTAILAHAQGIRTAHLTYYQVEGYTVFVDTVKGVPDEKGLNQIRRSNNIKNETHTIQNGVHVMTTSQQREDSIAASTIYFISAVADQRMQVIGFETMLERDTLLEQYFSRAIAENRIPSEVMTPWEIDTIQFAGRTIQLGPACKWMQVRSVQCPRAGQFNWAEFRTESQAQQMIHVMRTMHGGKNISKILEEKQVPVLFEGQQTQALQVRVKIKVPKLVMGGSNELIVYYVIAHVRGRYIGCVLSHYGDEAKAGELPPLLKEVMQLVTEK